jgi:hypothetical protein
MSVCAISLDLDDLWSYLRTHGDPGWSSRPSYLERFIPRVLETMDRVRIKSTFFIVGADAERLAGTSVLRAVVQAGHSIGNHSYEHEPWLDRYGDRRLEEEISRAEQAIESATGQRPRGFRGPGFSWSPALFGILEARGYRYDASILPTFVGPLARAYYFRLASLTPEQRQRRRALFGTMRDGLRPNTPYRWGLPAGRSLLEIPVTTFPVLRLPFHLSYLLYVSRWSEMSIALYLRAAARACRLIGVEPSFLLHPLDLLGGDEVPRLAFFPGMDIPSKRKVRLFERVMGLLRESFTLIDLDTHAHALLQRADLRTLMPTVRARHLAQRA